MDNFTQSALLDNDEPRPFQVEHGSGRSAYFLICDHAGTRIPRRLALLGLSEAEVQRHIGWDIGAAAVALKLADILDATLILQPYSRLVIDCNRPLHSSESIVSISELISIPGNQQVCEADVMQRQRELFMPYHARIRQELDTRQQRGQSTALIALHSFTPTYLGQLRPWHIGILYNRDVRLANLLSAALQTEANLVIGDNEPYNVSDDTDFSIPEHGERRGLPHVEIEIRQDLISDEAGQQQWALRLARLLLSLQEPLTLI